MFLLLPTLLLALQSHSAYMCPFVLFAGTHSLLIDCRKSNPTASSASMANQLLMGSDVSPLRGASSTGPGGSMSTSSPLTGAGSPEIPKSPPKWPLRPGVLAYVKGDTKQNICAARNGGSVTASMNHSTTTNTTTTANESALNKSAVSSSASGNNANGDRNSNKQPQGTETTASGGAVGNGIDSTVSAPGDRVLRKALKTIILSEDVAIQVEDDDDDDDEEEQDYERRTRGLDEEETNTNELINFTNSNFINRILKRLRWRRQGLGSGRRGSGGGIGDGLGFDNRRTSPSETTKKKTKKCRRRLLLLRKLPKNGLFGSWKSTNSHTELFDSTRHRPAGIKYPSSGNWLCFVYFSLLYSSLFIFSHAHSHSLTHNQLS